MSVCGSISTLSNMNFSETSWLIKIKFYYEHYWGCIRFCVRSDQNSGFNGNRLGKGKYFNLPEQGNEPGHEEHSGSVLECLTGDQEVASSSLTGDTLLCLSKTIYPLLSTD